MAFANDTLRFALELAALAAFAYWGVYAGDSLAADVVLAVIVPVAAAVAWGLFVSPKARWPVRGLTRIVAEVVYFGGATAALAVAKQAELAAALGVVASLHLVAHHSGFRSDSEVSDQS